MFGDFFIVMLAFDYWVWEVCLFYFVTVLSQRVLRMTQEGGLETSPCLAKLSKVLLSVQVTFRFFHLLSRVQI